MCCISYVCVLQVELLREMRYSWSEVADVLMISRTTLWRKLNDMNIPLSSYTTISNSDLDSVMSVLVSRFPQNGVVMMWGHLKSINIFITRQKVAESLMRVSPQLVQHRQSSSISRHVYNVPSPNYLWHIDGLHCLIRWKIVNHCAIDGFSRRIVYLQSADNNRSETVYSLFQKAVMECGWPSRVRSDKGGENIDVAEAMLITRGTDRQNHITGSSIHNQRIERLWRDTFRCVGHLYYAIFYELEDSGLLDVEDDYDLFALHYTFLPRINNQLNQFASAWNMHSLRTEGGLSPLQLWTWGLLSSSAEWQHQICSGLTVDDSLYGVESETDNYINSFDHQSVVVPPIHIDLSAQQLQYLRENFHPLQNSSNNGIDIYMAVRLYLENM